uniref:Uncharacterized protein n=1 Tax=Knipowitschia caucasica TaxID=637954 RepID=A0AAV2JAJ7_KNICA
MYEENSTSSSSSAEAMSWAGPLRLPGVTRPLTLSPSDDLGTPNCFAACLTVQRPDFTSISARSMASSVHLFFFVLPILSKWFLDGIFLSGATEIRHT